MLQPPVLPGYTYDPERKKYFKISNGDQRHNTKYSNNSVQTAHRRKTLEATHVNKKAKSNPRLPDASISAYRTTYCPDARDLLLNMRLGINQNLPAGLSTAMLLPSFKRYVSCGDFLIWPLFNELLVFISVHLGLALASLDSFLEHSINLIGMPHLAYVGLDNTLLDLGQVEVYDNWTFVFNGVNPQLFRWVEKHGNYRVENHTGWLRIKLRGLHPNHIDERGVCYHGQFGKDELQILSSKGWMIRFDLIRFEVSNHDQASPNANYKRLMNIVPEVANDAKLSVVDDLVLFNVGTDIFTVKNTNGNFTRWKFGRHIHQYYVDRFSIHTPGKTDSQQYYRLLVVTTGALFIKEFLAGTDLTVVNDTKIPLHNDNNAFPLCYRFGLFLLIETSHFSCTLIDMDSKSIAYVHFPSLSAFKEKKRIIEYRGHFYVCTRTQLFELQPNIATKMKAISCV